MEKKFTGQRLDSATGLYYYGAKYYDPEIGRFISADTIVPSVANPQSLNRYSYAVNNPLRYTDPTGNCYGPFAGMRDSEAGAAVCGAVDKAKALAVDVGERVEEIAGEGVDAAEDMYDDVSDIAWEAAEAVDEAAQWAVGVEEIETVQHPALGDEPVSVITAKDSGLNLVNRTMDVIARDKKAVAIGGTVGIVTRAPLSKQELRHAVHHIAEQRAQGWLEWHISYQVELWATDLLWYGDLDLAYTYHSAEYRARAAAREAQPPDPPDPWWWQDWW
jgi:RHS repeat-associated protein